MSDEEDINDSHATTVAKQFPEHLRFFPEAAHRKIGYIASSKQLLNAYCWRVGSQTLASLDDVQEDTEEFRIHLNTLLFPTPFFAETEAEARGLIAKIIVADGLWSSFILGAPFNHYMNDDGSRIYTDAEAKQIGMMFECALNSVGRLRLSELIYELIEILLLP